MLGVSEGADEVERHEAYRRLQGRLEEKLAKAPTPGLKAKYRDTLTKLDEAIETIELAADGGELPMLRPDFGSVESDPQPSPSEEDKDAVATSKRASASRSKSPGSRNGKEILVAIVLVLLMCGAGAGWWFGMENPKREMAARLVQQGMVHEKSESWDEAAEVYAEALSLKPSWKEALDGEKRVKTALEKIEAENARALAERDREVERLLVQARIAQGQDEWGEAFELYGKAASLDADNVEANEAVARLEKLLTNARGAVVVKTEPGGATIRLSGKGEELSPANYVDLKLGRYEVVIEKKGYDPVTQTAVVRKDDTTVMGPLRLNRSEGAVLVKSTPEGMSYELTQVSSDVKSDREFEPRSGRTPGVEADLPTGEYEVVMKRSSWPDYKRRLTVARDLKEEVDWEFGQGTLELVSVPSGMSVYQVVGGGEKLLGKTPLSLDEQPVGTYEVVFKREGWPDGKTQVEVANGKTGKGVWEFSQGRMKVVSEPAGAMVRGVGGKELGVTPLEVEVPTGVHVIEVEKQGYEVAELRVEVMKGKTATASPVLKKIPYPLAGKPYTNDLGMKFVPAGSNGVLFSVYETRVKDFETFVKETGYDATSGMYSLDHKEGYEAGFVQVGRTWKSPGHAQGPDYALCGVSWNDAKAFCKWLTERERKAGRIRSDQEYRLPSDHEWSVAVGLNESASGTPKSKDQEIAGVYPWGNNYPPKSDDGNYAGSEAKVGSWPWNWTLISGHRDAHARVAPVGSYKANKYGLHDMGGNVLEWCEDWFSGDRKRRVLRGGGWDYHDQHWFLSSLRHRTIPDYRGSNRGFRCVLVCGGGG